jgi:hypothetical protein
VSTATAFRCSPVVSGGARAGAREHGGVTAHHQRNVGLRADRPGRRARPCAGAFAMQVASTFARRRSSVPTPGPLRAPTTDGPPFLLDTATTTVAAGQPHPQQGERGAALAARLDAGQRWAPQHRSAGGARASHRLSKACRRETGCCKPTPRLSPAAHLTQQTNKSQRSYARLPSNSSDLPQRQFGRSALGAHPYSTTLCSAPEPLDHHG